MGERSTGPRADDRIRLEGKLEKLETALEDLRRLEGELDDNWLDRLPFRLDLVARVLLAEESLEPLAQAASKYESTAPLAAEARALREALAGKLALRLEEVGVAAHGSLAAQLRQLVERTPLARGYTNERTRRGAFPFIFIGVAAIGTPLFGLSHWLLLGGVTVGLGLVGAGVSAWRNVSAGPSLWVLEPDRIAIYPPDGEPWAVELGALTGVTIATNRQELHLTRTPLRPDGRGTPVVPLATTQVARVAGLLELYRTLEWQTRGRFDEGDCALVSAALSPGLQGWALVCGVGAVFVRHGVSEEATFALTGRRARHLLTEDALLRELSRLPDRALKVLMPLLDGVEGCAFLPAEELQLQLEPRLHLWTKTQALTLGAEGEDRARLERWFRPVQPG